MRAKNWPPGFVLTNQRDKAIEMLQEIIKQHPEKYQPYDLLAQLLDEGARALARANQPEPAKAEFAKAAANYEQSLLINPGRAQHLSAPGGIAHRAAEGKRTRGQDSHGSAAALSQRRRSLPTIWPSRCGRRNIRSKPSSLSKKLSTKLRATTTKC